MRLFIFLLLILSTSITHSQNPLTSSEQLDYRDETVRKVNTFFNYVNRVSNGSAQSAKYQSLAVNLFEPKAVIEVANISQGASVIRNYTPRDYMVALSRYSGRFIRTATHFESLKVTSFTKATDPKTKEVYYVGTASFVMSFCGDKTKEIEGWEVCNYTEKDIEVVIRHRSSLAGDYWILLLGDITVEEIKKL